MAKGWINQWTVNAGKWYPTLCGDCKFWIDYVERDDFGGKGYCSKMDCTSYRTDWCHLPEEVERHKQAMDSYVFTNYKGEHVCKQEIS